MSLTYHPNIRQLFADRIVATIASNASITIYSGTQPSSATIQSSWSSYNSSSSSFLYHNPNNGLVYTRTGGVTVYASAFPSLAIPTRAGTASWAILWQAQVSNTSIAAATIPNASFIVVPVTVTTGNGVLKVNSVAFTTSTAVTISSIGFTVAL